MKNVVFILMVALAFVSCQMPTGVVDDGSSGMAEVAFFFGDTISANAIEPGEDYEDVAEYELTLTGPGASQVITTIDKSLYLNLEPGDWSLIVTAYNSDGTTIGAGSKDFTLVDGPNDVNIQVNPMNGVGQLSITVDYSEISVTYPDITFSLDNGNVYSTVNGDFEAGENSASFTTSLNSGTYLLNYEITDGSWEHTENNIQVVIRQGMTSSATFGHGNVTVSIDNNLSAGLYPEIEWVDEPNDGFTISSSATAPSGGDSFFNHKSLNFAVSYESSSYDFNLTEATISAMDIDFNSDGFSDGDMVNFLVTGLQDVTPLYNHDIEVTMLWEVIDGSYYEDVFTRNISSTVSFDNIMLADNMISGFDDGTGTPAFKIAFKEIRFIADDGVNYYTWTNPEL